MLTSVITWVTIELIMMGDNVGDYYFIMNDLFISIEK